MSTTPEEGAGEAKESAPKAAYQRWLGLSWTRHLGGVLALASLAFLRWRHDLLVPGPRVDEAYYLNAFEWLRQGDSPYRETAYFYPPAFAYLGAWLLSVLPPLGVVYLFRAANLLGLCWTLWLSLAVIPAKLPWRLAIGAGALWLSQGVALGMSSGNLSFAVMGAGLWALVHWSSRPVTAGVTLGLGVAVKPLFPAGILALAGHGARTWGGRHRWAGGLAGLLAVGAIAGVPYLGEMLAQATSDEKSSRAFSLARMLANFGLSMNPVWVAMAVALATLLFVQGRRLAPFQVLMVGVSACVLATPLLWSHTLLMTLPIQVLALTLALLRWRSAVEPVDRRYRLYEVAAVAALMGSILACDGIDGVYGQPDFVQGLVIAFPTFAPSILTAYALRHAEPF